MRTTPDDGLAPARTAVFPTARGACRVAWTDEGIAWLELPGAGRDAPPLPDDAPAWLRDAVDRIARHLAGEPQDLAGVPLDLAGTPPFARRVYAALREVPPGAVVTYGELARTVDCPNGARAVGGAMARNPLPLLIPCHRVIGASGALGGFSAPGGIETKAALLKLEGRA